MLLRAYGLWTRAWLRLAGSRRRQVEAVGYRVVVHELGPRQAPAWLLLHGLGATAVSWMPLLRSVHRRQRLLVPELGALGGTSGPWPAVRVGDAPEVLGQILTALGLTRGVGVIGMSLGGWMAVRLALAHPQMVQRLVLIDCAGWQDQDWDRVRSLVSLDSRDDVERLYRALFVRTPALLRWSRGTFFDAYRSPAVRSLLEHTREEDTFTARDLERISVPTALVWGERDGLFPIAIAREMAASLPVSRLEIVPGCGHGLHWECRERFVAAVERAMRFQATAAG